MRVFLNAYFINCFYYYNHIVFDHKSDNNPLKKNINCIN